MLAALLFICVAVIAVTEPLKCYEGSKGETQGVSSSNFIEKICDDGMIHCFESYSDDLTEITASCQTPNTERKLLKVCDVGCENHPTLNVTVCCCDSDLCNLPDSEKPTKPPAAAAIPHPTAHHERRHKNGQIKLSKSL